ncbi:unknown [Clostridium sp. CAG:452]|nr:unknown [Clostridium sp. CAG:452]
MPNEIKESISTYGGFYIGRYETCNESNTPIIRKGKTVWQNASKGVAEEKSANMYANNDYVVSHLIYDAQWDATLKFMQKKDSDFLTNPKDGVNGNYSGTVKESGCYKICNIYDIGGNIDERVMDPMNIPPTGNYVIRGYRKASAAFRSYGWGDAAHDWYGFRTVMYLKNI